MDKDKKIQSRKGAAKKETMSRRNVLADKTPFTQFWGPKKNQNEPGVEESKARKERRKKGRVSRGGETDFDRGSWTFSSGGVKEEMTLLLKTGKKKRGGQ